MISFAHSRLCTASALAALALPAAVMAQPTVSNVQFTQQATPTGTEVVITYDLVSPSRPANITLGLSKDGGTDNYVFPITSATGDLTNVAAGTGKSITWGIATDYPNEAIPNARIRVTADDGCPEAKNDFVATDDNTVLNGNVFADNGAGPDEDTGGGTLTVTQLNSNGALVGVPTVLASGATLTLNSNGTFSYDPTTSATFNALQVGQQAADSFTYTLTDGTPTCPSVATVNVTINGANDAPVVAGESYDTVGNTTLQVAATKTIDGSVFVVGNLLTNDSDVDGPNPLRTVLQSVNSVTGNVNLDGTFAMTPLAGTPGPCSFTYRVEDGLTSTNGTVTITQVGRIWYVQNNAAPGGTGRSTDPFDTLIEAQDNSVAGETIYIHTGDGTTTGQNAGITVKANQRLIGEGSPLGAPGTVNGVANPQLRAAGSPPQIGHAAGSAITVAQNNTMRGFNIGNRAGGAIFGSNFGTLTADTISITGTGDIFNLTNGTLAASFPSASSSSAFSAISITTCSGSLDIDAGTISGSTTAPIFIAGGNLNLTYSGSVSQSNNAPLVSISGGHTGTVQFDTGTLSATNGTGLQFNNSDGVYNFLGATTLNGGDAGIDITNGSDGNFSFNNAPITNPSGIAFNVDGGAGSIGHAGAISKTNTGRLVSIFGRSGGSVTLTGNLSNTNATPSSAGILVQSCTGGTVTFSGGTKTLNTGPNQAVTLNINGGTTIDFTGGGLDIDTTTGAGFSAIGGAAGLSVQGTGNTIDSISATALSVAGVSISSAGLTFQRISSGNNNASADPANGIVLNTTGSSGGLTVTGTGAADSGGVIQNCTATGVLMTSATSVSLSRMRIQGSGDDGINTSDVNGFTLADSSVLNNGNSTTDEGIEVLNPVGTITFTNVTATGNAHNNVVIDDGNNTGGDSALAVTGGSFSSTGTPNGNHGFLMTIRGTANLAASTISNATFSNNFSIGLQVTGGDTATVNGLTVSGCTFSDTGTGNSQEIAMDFSKAQQSNMTVKVLNNTITGHNSHGMNFFTGAGVGTTGTYNATISGNIIGNAAIAGSGSLIGNGIRININGDADATVLVDNNTIRQCPNGRGIEAISRNGTGGLDITITNNNVNPQDTSGFPLAAIFAQSNTVGTGNTLRADIRGNTVPAGTVFDLLSTYITLVETSTSTCQLVDTAPASANATAQLTSTNTGSASANAGVSLIAGPISLPPP